MLPMLRSHHPPHFAARGTALGLALAFTPTIGLHTLIAGALWAATARIPKLRFSLILAIAWTWVSNPLTVFPIYYLLYVTGQVILGHWSDLSGYDDFLALARDLAEGDRSLLENTKLLAHILLDDWGLTMLVGSVPWVIVTGGLGYWGSLSFMTAYRREKATRRVKHATKGE